MSGNRDPLPEALRQWQVNTPLPPTFREQVWQRIERAEAFGVSPITVFASWLQSFFARPVFALAYVTVLAVAGLALGLWQARERTAEWDNRLAARYVQAIDPYQKITH